MEAASTKEAIEQEDERRGAVANLQNPLDQLLPMVVALVAFDDAGAGGRSQTTTNHGQKMLMPKKATEVANITKASCKEKTSRSYFFAIFRFLQGVTKKNVAYQG